MSSKMKNARRFILGGLLSLLGFSSCEPDEPDAPVMYGPPVYMYGPPAASRQYPSQDPGSSLEESALPVIDLTEVEK